MRHRISRRGLLTWLASLQAAVPFAAMAQPARVLRIVVPFPAGGTADVLPRILAEKVRAAYPAGIIVDNRSGAGGNIGADLVAHADPDGTTFLASPPGPIAINNHLYKSLSFDPGKWVPITLIATVPNVLNVRKDFPASNVAEFLAYLKSNPGKSTFASQGNGSTSHLTGTMFMQLTGTQMLHVPYKGTSPALADLVGGTVDVFFDNLSSSLPLHNSGKTKILAIADRARSPQLAKVPTFIESNVPGMVAVTFFSLVAPAGTPSSTIAYAYKAFSAALQAADVRQKFADQGATPGALSPDKTAEFIHAESLRWGAVIKAANVTLD